jgi:hypothetical protein
LVEPLELCLGHSGQQGIGGALASTSAARNGRAFDPRRRRQDDLGGSQGRNHTGDNWITKVAAPGGLRRRFYHEWQVAIARGL